MCHQKLWWTTRSKLIEEGRDLGLVLFLCQSPGRFLKVKRTLRPSRESKIVIENHVVKLGLGKLRFVLGGLAALSLWLLAHQVGIKHLGPPFGKE